MTLYGIKTCDTCRKALKALQEGGVSVEFIDLRVTPLDAAQWEAFHDALGDALLNTRSTTWRGLDEASRSRPVPELMLDHPTLMKRPLIEAEDGSFSVGWSKATQDKLL